MDGINGTSGIDGKDGIGINGLDGLMPWWLYVIAAFAGSASFYSVYKSRQKSIGEDIEKHVQEMRKTVD
jgi:hypothetical protein